MEYWYRIIFFLFFFGAIVSGSTLKSNKTMNMPCTLNEDCESGYFCFKSKMCTECIDCQLYHREPGKEPCIVEPQQCGSCLTGFESVTLTNHRKKDYCEKSSTTANPPPLSENSLYYIISSVMGVIIIISIAVCFFKKISLRCNLEYIKKIIRKGEAEESNDNPSQIPSNPKNIECIPELNQSEESINQCKLPSNFNEFRFKEEEQNVQARVFSRPYYDHNLTHTIINEPTTVHEPPFIQIASAPPPYSPTSMPEPPIIPVSAGIRNPESTASRDTVNGNTLPSENMDQNNLKVPTRRYSMDAHARFWQEFPNFQIINKVLVSNVNDNSSKNTQIQNNDINSGLIDGNNKALIYKLTEQNDE